MSQPIRSWNTNLAPAVEVGKLIARSGEDVLGRAEDGPGRIEEQAGTLHLPARGTVTFLEQARGPAMVRALDLAVPKEHAIDFGRTRLRVTWDHRHRVGLPLSPGGPDAVWA